MLLSSRVKHIIESGDFVMLRWEHQFSPATGITAVTKQERRIFLKGITVAPFHAQLKRRDAKSDPVKMGELEYTGDEFKVAGHRIRVLSTTDSLSPMLLVEIEGRCSGKESPYDLPVTELKTDTLLFAMAAQELVRDQISPNQWVWAADWETVPALLLVDAEVKALTIHNVFDECLEKEARPFGSVFSAFYKPRSDGSSMAKTALEVGLEIADVVTTVNKGFAKSFDHELLHTQIMAPHLIPLLRNRLIGINNADFYPLSSGLRELRDSLTADLEDGAKQLFALRHQARESLRAVLGEDLRDKVVLVSMGRRVSQKLHEVLVASLRKVLLQDPALPIFAVFATVTGDESSHLRLARIRELAADFPRNVVCLDGLLPFYEQLMAAADYNCMPSLYEPHGGAFTGTVVPIARAIDGLAEQICPYEPSGVVAQIAALCEHNAMEKPSGFSYREPSCKDPAVLPDLAGLLRESLAPDNLTFRQMRDELSGVLLKAVNLRHSQPLRYAELVLAALNKQGTLSWHQNLGGMQALVQAARLRKRAALLASTDGVSA